MAKEKENSDLPSFQCPPVVEVVMGVQFNEPLNIRTLDVAEIWEALGKKTYPDYRELRRLDPILPANVVHFEISDAPDFPRYLFKKSDNTGLIQFQKDRFVYHWTKPDGAPSDCYPRYESIVKEFIDHYKKTLKVFKSHGYPIPKPAVMELTYVNLIDYKQSDMSGIGRIFKGIEWRSGDSFLPPPTRMNLGYGFQIDELKAMLTATIGLVQLVRDGSNMLKLELSVKGPLQDHTDTAMIAWCETARKWIVNGFADLTTPEMHEKWERRT